MKIKLLLVGKTDNKHLSALIEEYESRISHYLPYEEIIIPELRNAKNLSEEQQKQQEGSEILRRIGVSDRMVLLDERGDENRSIEFASWLTRQMNSGVKTLWLVVGGPYGFSKAVYDRATV